MYLTKVLPITTKFLTVGKYMYYGQGEEKEYSHLSYCCYNTVKRSLVDDGAFDEDRIDPIRAAQMVPVEHCLHQYRKLLRSSS